MRTTKNARIQDYGPVGGLTGLPGTKGRKGEGRTEDGHDGDRTDDETDDGDDGRRRDGRTEDGYDRTDGRTDGRYIYIYIYSFKVSNTTLGPKFECPSVSTIKPPIWTRIYISALLLKYPGSFLSL